MGVIHYNKSHTTESFILTSELVDKYSISYFISDISSIPTTFKFTDAINFLQSLSKTKPIRWRYGIIELESNNEPTERISIFTDTALLTGQFYIITRNDRVESPKYKFTTSENWKTNIVDDYYLELVESRFKNGKPKFRRAMTDKVKQYKIIDIFKILIELNKTFFDEETFNKAFKFIDEETFEYSLFGVGLHEYLKNKNNINSKVSIDSIVENQSLDYVDSQIYFENQLARYPKYGDDEKDVRRIDIDKDFDYS